MPERRRPSRLWFCSKWVGSAASPAGENIRNVRRSTADVERGDVVGPPVKVELDAEDTAPAQRHDNEILK